MTTRNDLRGFLKERSSAADGRSSQYTNSDASQSGKECEEVVKYMSKLPAYLKGEESNHDVLNVGVLDWSRLEKWKKHGRGAADKCERKVSSTTLGTLPNASSHLQVHACANLLSKVKAASRDLQHSSSPELASSSYRDSLNKQDISTCSSFYKPSSARRDQERVKNPGRLRSYHHREQVASSGLLSDMGNSGGSLGAKASFVETDEKRAGEVNAAQEEARQGLKQCVDKFDGEENHQVSSNIVLLRSRKQSEVNLCALDDVSSLGLGSEDMKLPLLSGRKERSGGTTRRHSKTASRIFDQEKSRHHSPSKRFSFSFGRLSRSFTFKEDSSSAAQPLTSSSFDDHTINNKSDSMRFDGSSQSSNPEEEKHCGSRVSPTLRRLIDHPLLKSKGSEDVLPPSKAKAKAKAKARSTSFFNQDEKKKKKKQDASRTQGALLQLTIRNGIPLFQFVVDDDDNNKRRSILGATMKSSASSVKEDSVQYCTFYSVNEVVKKKRSWLIKEKQQQQQHRFVYSVIGEMRLCNSDITTVMRESVLVDESEQRKEVAAVMIKKTKPTEETTVIIPGGVHSIPEKGAPTPLISRWRSGGCCDCGGWDVGCKLHVLLSNKTSLLHDLEDQTFKLYDQEEESDKNSGPVLAMTELKTGMYRVEFGSFLSHLQAFFVCVTVITCDASEEETVSKTTGKSSSPFAPPLSPVGRA